MAVMSKSSRLLLVLLETTASPTGSRAVQPARTSTPPNRQGTGTGMGSGGDGDGRTRTRGDLSTATDLPVGGYHLQQVKAHFHFILFHLQL